MSAAVVARLRHPALLNMDFRDGPSPQLLSPLAPSTPLLGSPSYSEASTPIKTPSTPVSPTGVGAGHKKNKKKKGSGSSSAFTAAAGDKTSTSGAVETITPVSKPIPSYALLRSAHATALKMTIAKMRHEQWNNGYLRTPELPYGPWQEYEYQISKLEEELELLKATQEGLDRFPNCYAPIQPPKEHGPQTQEAHDKAYQTKIADERKMNMKMDEEFPWLRQQFIGPMTKRQARHDDAAREMLRERDIDDIEMLLEEPNKKLFVKWLEEMQGKAGGGKKKKSYQEERMEKEEKRVKEMLRESQAKAKDKAEQEENEKEKAREGKERSKDGPKDKAKDKEVGQAREKDGEKEKGPGKGKDDKEEAERREPTPAEKQLLVQREQRHAILTWLRQPWGVFEEEAAGLIEKMGKVAIQRLTEKRRGSKVEDEAAKDKEEEGEKQTEAEEKKKKGKEKGGEDEKAQKEERENGADVSESGAKAEMGQTQSKLKKEEVKVTQQVKETKVTRDVKTIKPVEA